MARHVLVSYNSESVLSLRATLVTASVDENVRRFVCRYRRYRAEIDREGRRHKRD